MDQEQTLAERDELSDALRRVCADSIFSRSAQSRRLLEYLVAGALAQVPHIKEYTIAIEALGRPHSFDPERDAIVRVQAGRLRRALDKYYGGSGRDDPVRLVLPLGSYAVQCERRTLQVQAPRPVRGWRLRAAAVVAVFALIIGAFALASRREGSPAISGPITIASVAVAPIQNGLPTVVVVAIEGAATDTDLAVLGELQRRTASAFSRFETVNVVNIPRPVPGEVIATPRPHEGAPFYSLSALASRRDDVISIEFQFAHLPFGTIVWTQTFALPLDGDAAVHQENIVRRMATKLLQPFGVVASHERAYQLQTGTGDPRYRCILQAAAAMREATNEAYADARSCLERVTDAEPGNVLAQVYLVSILTRIYQFGWPVEPGIRDQALAAARRAVFASPASARAHFALFLARFNMREFKAADDAFAQVRALNDDDLVMRSVYGGRLITHGRVDEGMAILEDVAHAFPARFCAHGFYLFLGHYLRGNMGAAHRDAHELTCPSYPIAFIAKALAHLHSGQMDQVQSALESAATLMPGWRSDPRSVLERTIPDAAIVDRILLDLKAADLAGGGGG